MMIEDFPYIKVDFQGRMDLVLLEGEDWDVSGEKPKQSCQVFFDFKTYIIFFWYIEEFLTDVSFHHVDRGATCPTEISTLGRRGDAQIVVDQGVAARGLQEVEKNLQGLTMGIPPLRRWEVPLHLQRHTVECLRVLTLY
jgi:hypothetical protein